MGLRGGSGVLGERISRRVISSSRPSGEVKFLSSFVMAASSDVIDVWLSFDIFLR